MDPANEQTEEQKAMNKLGSVETMSFGQVLEIFKGDVKGEFARTGWNGKGMCISLQEPDEHSANTLPYIYFITAQGDRVPWVASQTDMLADDWYNINEVE